MAYKEFGATIAPANISGSGFPIAMGSHIGGGRTINGKNNLKLWQLLGEGTDLTEQKNNAIGQIWYDRSDSKYYKLTGFTGDTPNWVEYLDTSNINGTTNYVTKFTGTHSIGNSLIYDNGTKVGIGTTNPGVRFVNSGASLASSPTLGSGVVGANAILSQNGLYGLYTGVSVNGDVWQQVQRNDTNTSTYRLLLNPLGGNVGIGTTNPYEKLEVVGNIETDHIKLNNSVTFLDNSAEKGGMRYNIINKTIEFFFI